MVVSNEAPARLVVLATGPIWFKLLLTSPHAIEMLVVIAAVSAVVG
jgi:hypothetical protein